MRRKTYIPGSKAFSSEGDLPLSANFCLTAHKKSGLIKDPFGHK